MGPTWVDANTWVDSNIWDEGNTTTMVASVGSYLLSGLSAILTKSAFKVHFRYKKV